MSFFCAKTGELAFSDGFRLWGGMPAGELEARYRDPQNGELTLCLGAHPLRGGSLAPVCTVDSGGLRAVALHPGRIEGKAFPSAERQRALLFAALGLKDPCPDTRRSVRVRCPFGEIILTSDPYTGCASARLEYSR